MSEPADDKPVRIAMIAAVGANGVIGAKGSLPWRLPSDMAFFKKTTMGKPLVMGRKQYESVGRPLPGRPNLVVSRQAGYAPEGVSVFADFEAALAEAERLARAEGGDEVMIIGGGEIYAIGLAHADRLYITHVNGAPEGDTFFPAVSWHEWVATDLPEITPGERDTFTFSVRIYDRVRGAH